MEEIIIIAVILFIFLIGFSIYKSKNTDNSNYTNYKNLNNLENKCDKAGISGEEKVNNCLNDLKSKDEYLLTNLLIPTKSNSKYKNEIDSVFISKKGIFCIEVKKWVGCIYGNDEDEYWVQRYDNPHIQDERHNNPVKHNQIHCNILGRILNERYCINCIVIFVDLEKNAIESNCTYTLSSFINYYDDLPIKFNANQLTQIYSKLVIYEPSQEELEEYKESINDNNF